MLEFKAHFKSVQPDLGGSLPGNLIFGIPGKDGGYYLVAAEQVDANTIRFTFTPSQSGMPAVDPIDVDLPGATDEQIRKIIEEYLRNNPAIGQPGKDGFSPIAKVTQTEDGAVITITDKNDTTEVFIANGRNGYTPQKGIDYDDGKSAYEYAKDGGYTGTEAEFAAKLAEEYPDVPEWAMADSKPSYSKSEVGLGSVDNVRQYSDSNPPPYPVVSVNGKTGKVTLGAADVGARPSNWMPTAAEVGALPDTYVPPNQTAAQVGADPAGTATAAVSTHNTSTDSHGDLRIELKAINDRLTAFFDSDNQTLDELSEIVAYITSNKTLIDSITTSKVSVADIINNLATNVANKPLSAAQGVVLKGLIDAVGNSLSNYQPKGDYALRSELPTVPTKVSQLQNDKGYLTEHQDISGKLDADKLPEAVNNALAQAKEIGEFDGADGYTPVRGVDYYTEADKTEIVAMVIESLGGNPVFGYVDENNNIVVQGNLPDGTYSVKYEMENGSAVDIGDLVLDTNVYYTVTHTLTNCVSSNSDTQAIGGKSYTATITANDGYELSSVVVTMGGNAVTVTNGVINIAKVTGNIVITAVATEVQKEPTNFADPTSSDWKVGYRLTDNITQVKALTGGVATNYIAVQAGDIVTVEGINFTDTNNRIAHDGVNAGIGQANVYATTYTSQGLFENVTYNSNSITLTVKIGTISNMRFSGLATGTSNDVVVKIKRNGAWL